MTVPPGISFRLCIQWRHVGSLKLAVVYLHHGKEACGSGSLG